MPSKGKCAKSPLKQPFHKEKYSLFDRRSMMRCVTAGQDLLPIGEIPVVTLSEHFVGGKARPPAQFALCLADIEVKRTAIHQRVISPERRKSERTGKLHQRDCRYHRKAADF